MVNKLSGQKHVESPRELSEQEQLKQEPPEEEKDSFIPPQSVPVTSGRISMESLPSAREYMSQITKKIPTMNEKDLKDAKEWIKNLQTSLTEAKDSEDYKNSAWYQARDSKKWDSSRLFRWIGRPLGYHEFAEQVNSLDKSLQTLSKNIRNKEKLLNPKLAATTFFQDKFKARLEAQTVRKSTVFPSEIRKFLENNLGDLQTSSGGLINLDVLGKTLAREILAFANDKTLYNGHGKYLLEEDSVYAFPKFDNKNRYVGKENLTLPVGVWAKKTEDGKGIELELIGKQLGEGAYKNVLQSKPFRIDLQTVAHQKSIEDAVLVRAKSEKTEKVLGGIQVIKNNFSSEELKDPKLRLAGILTHTNRELDGNLEARDVRYLGDFDKVKNSLNNKQKFQILADTAQTLEILHDKDLIHRDVKPPNILIVKKGGRGHLADFDMTQKQGTSEAKDNYLYWDTLSQNGYVTPFTDSYGLAQSAAEILFGADFTRMGGGHLRDLANESIRHSTLNRLDLLGIKNKPEGQSPEQILKSLEEPDFKNNLMPAEVKSLEKLIDQTKLLMQTRDIIAAVFDANERLTDYMDLHPEVLTNLDGNPTQVKDAISQLRTEFPEFGNFLSEIKRTQVAFAKVAKE